MTVDLNGNYNFSERVSIGLQVANLFDDRHWEAFGWRCAAAQSLDEPEVRLVTAHTDGKVASIPTVAHHAQTQALSHAPPVAHTL